MTAFVQAEDRGGARWLTLCNVGRKNAIGPAMVGELLQALRQADQDSTVRVVVLTGQGETFCAGGDFGQMSPSGEQKLVGDYAELLLAMTRFEKPIISRVMGVAMGGGLGLVAASHFAVLSSETKLATPEINVGLFPMMIMAVLSRSVPRKRLMEMMLLGEKFDAARALELGLATRVVAPTELDAVVERLVEQLASKSPSSLRMGLRAFAAQDDLALADSLPMLRDGLASLLATDDAREGLTAFLEKRAPVWVGH